MVSLCELCCIPADAGLVCDKVDVLGDVIKGTFDSNKL